jgi:hypothetical protein
MRAAIAYPRVYYVLLDKLFHRLIHFIHDGHGLWRNASANDMQEQFITMGGESTIVSCNWLICIKISLSRSATLPMRK